MILQALVDYYEALAERGEIARPGWGLAKVSYALSLDENGRLLHVTDVRHEEPRGKDGKKTWVPTVMEVPEPVKRSSGVAANLLCDNSAYLLGIDKKGKPERTLQCFEACRALHQKVFGMSDHPAAKAVTAFFESWKPEAAAEHPALQEALDAVQDGGNLVFRYRMQYVHAIPELRALCQAYKDQTQDGPEMQCLVTGKVGPVAVLHPSIKGVRDAQSSGASLVSFNAPAFTSYGREQGYNAPVGTYAAFAYGAALNYLLADSNRVKFMGDTTVVCWAQSGEPAYQDMWNMGIMGDSTAELERDVQAALTALADGRSVTWEQVELRPEEHFYVLGLAPNAARLSVRFFLRDSFGAFMRHVRDHEARLQIVKPSYERFTDLPYWRLLAETVNQKSRDKKPVPQLAGDFLRAILSGDRYPATLYNGVLLRIRADREINYARAALLKAYLIRNFEEEITVNLDEQRTQQAYVLGRLFSVLEEIQESANPGVNATIHDRYFSAAGSTPGRVFPVLVDLANKHLRKLKKEVGRKIYLEKKLSEIMGLLQEGYPDQLSLKEKGVFQIGYYHQNQTRYTKKEEQ